ncbi:MAG: hypothetical protein K6F74_05360 [Prevotella sp.]|nr:hypothetical protein [Prevotella sp.]
MENLGQHRPEVNSQRWLDISDLPNEVWLDIQGYEGVYQISCYGRIKSLPRTKRYGSFVYPAKIIKSYLGKAPKNNYYIVVLQKDGAKSTKRVCRLVASAFIDNPSNLPQVNHIDENTHNDTAWNLEWCTASYNNSYGEHPKKVSKAAKERTRTGKCFDGSAFQGNMVAPVLQYDLDGNFIREFESVKEAREKYSSRVQDCLSGKATQAGGFQWKYKIDATYPYKIDAYTRNINQSLCCSRPIKQLKDGVVVATYGSIKEASAKTGFDYSGIKKCLNGTYKQTFGFTWEYDDCPNYKKKVIHYGTK